MSGTVYAQNTLDPTESSISKDTLFLPATVILPTGDTIVAISLDQEASMYRYIEEQELACSVLVDRDREIVVLDSLVAARETELVAALKLKNELFTQNGFLRGRVQLGDVEARKALELNGVLNKQLKRNRIKTTVITIGGVVISVGLLSALIYSLTK